MNVIYFGHFYSPRTLKTIKDDSKTPIGFCNHNFELSLVRGLSKQHDIDLRVFTLAKIYSFPSHWRRFYTASEDYNIGETAVHSVGICNFVFINKIWEVVASTFFLLKYAGCYKDKDVKIITNAPNFFSLLALTLCRLLSTKKFEVAVIVPDIPSIMTSYSRAGSFKKKVLGLLNKLTDRMICKVDHLVLLTEQMKDFFPHNSSYIVMEGLVDMESMSCENHETEDKFVFLYTGTLAKMYGIRNLVNAFMQTKMEDAQLWICGGGDSKDYIENCVLRDKRIKFLGLVDSKQALKFQNSATVLVNPRTSEGAYTKYSFPSKTMEYLLAHKPVIMNRLSGVPKEYFEYIITPEDESIDALSDALNKVYSMSKVELDNIATRGYKFVTIRKNSNVQTRKILEMFK